MSLYPQQQWAKRVSIPVEGMNVFSFLLEFFYLLLLCLPGRRMWMLPWIWDTHWPYKQATTGFTITKQWMLRPKRNWLRWWEKHRSSREVKTDPDFKQKSFLQIKDGHAMGTITEPWRIRVKGNLLRRKKEEVLTKKITGERYRASHYPDARDCHHQCSLLEGREDLRHDKYKMESGAQCTR